MSGRGYDPSIFPKNDKPVRNAIRGALESVGLAPSRRVHSFKDVQRRVWRSTDSPAEVWKDPDGKTHRVDGPAVVSSSGVQEWREHGDLHRNDGPAIIRPERLAINTDMPTEEWYRKNQRHREDGPALVWPNGKEEWYLHGELHREDGPAIIEYVKTFADKTKIKKTYAYRGRTFQDTFSDRRTWKRFVKDKVYK